MRRILLPLINPASRATGTSTPIPEIGEFQRIIVGLNVTVLPGTSLYVATEIQDPISENWTRVQSKFAGRNINGTHTVGDWSLGEFRTVLSTDAVPYTEIRVLSVTEGLTEQLRFNYTVSGANPTFSISVVGSD